MKISKLMNYSADIDLLKLPMHYDKTYKPGEALGIHDSARVNQQPPMHNPLDGRCNSVVVEPII